MISKFNECLSDIFPTLGKPKRMLLAYIAKYSKVKKSYSQIGEDRIAIDILNKRALSRPIFYIDVGANHPSRLSNTYRMYREGSAGLCIEPNSELIRLHRLVRPRDIQLAVGCGQAMGIMKFYFSKTPVLSSFSQSEVDKVWKTDYLPIFTLDKICVDLEITSIDFLSIDVEGLDLNVLEGGQKALRMTYLVCIEANTSDSEVKIIKFMQESGFELALKNKWNLFFINQNSAV